MWTGASNVRSSGCSMRPPVPGDFDLLTRRTSAGILPLAGTGAYHTHRGGLDMEDAALTRRRLILRAGAAGLAATQLDVVGAAAAPAPPRPSTPTAALNALLAGNRRYAKGNIQRVDYNRLGERIAQTQKQIAAIITCA